MRKTVMFTERYLSKEIITYAEFYKKSLIISNIRLAILLTGNVRSQQFYDSLSSNSVGKTEMDQHANKFSMRLIGNQGVNQKSLSSTELDALGVF